MTVQRQISASEMKAREGCNRARKHVAESPDDPERARMLRDQVRALVKAWPAVGISENDRSDPIHRARQLIEDGEDEAAEVLLRSLLAQNRANVAAMRLMADIAGRCGFPDNAAKILKQALSYNPSDANTWEAVGQLTYRLARDGAGPAKAVEALAAFDRALELNPDLEESLSNRAILLMQLRRLDEAERAFRKLLATHPGDVQGWVNLAFLLKTTGDFGGSVAAYRTGAATNPRIGASWWGLANLKRAKFHDFDILEMERTLEEDLVDEHRIDIHFALATALEKAGDFEAALKQYEIGNKLRLTMRPHDAGKAERSITAAISLFSTDFFAEREGKGHPSREPIFIVSMPRSGSTLLEQILANHPDVEGTEELVAIPQIEGELLQRFNADNLEEALEQLPNQRLAPLGERYIALTKLHRRTNSPHFTDKKPSNWRQLGLISCILPNAKVVEIRRNPLDCCLANYKQHYAKGIDWSYGLEEVAGEYRQYLAFMNHFARVQPGRVHRIIYEDLVENFEAEVRRLLAFLGIPFYEQCLQFHSSDRPVHTPSAAQVRRPINRDGIGQWKNFPSLAGRLELALRDALANWRD